MTNLDASEKKSARSIKRMVESEDALKKAEALKARLEKEINAAKKQRKEKLSKKREETLRIIGHFYLLNVAVRFKSGQWNPESFKKYCFDNGLLLMLSNDSNKADEVINTVMEIIKSFNSDTPSAENPPTNAK